jgi:meso-butanediol dehydrogenase / (S,S)-butanediol dehydrogenase / diacetyl reductase
MSANEPGGNPLVQESRSALVSGAGTGIGRATALLLAESGYGVALVGRRPQPLDQVKDEITAQGGRAVTISADVGSPDGAESAVAATLEAFGSLDTLICNHGVGASAPVGDETPEGWDSTLRINLNGPFLLARAAIPHLLASRGSIVNVSSTNGCQAGPGWASYDVSKAGVIMLTRSLANEYGPQGVRANCVCPGWVRTPMGDEGMQEVTEKWGCSLEDAYWLCAQDTPLRRPGEAAELSEVIVFLAGPKASYVSGATVVVDGGGMAVDGSSTAFRGPQQRLRELLA